MAGGNFSGGKGGADAASIGDRAGGIIFLHSQPSSFFLAMAAPGGVGRAGGYLDFYFRGELFDPRPDAGRGGKSFAAVAGSGCGIAPTTADAGGINRRDRFGRCGPVKERCAGAAHRAGGNNDGVETET